MIRASSSSTSTEASSSPHVGDLLQAEHGLAQVERADEGALALGGGDQPAVEKDVDGAADGHGADPERGAQLRLGGELVAGPVDARPDLFGDGVGDVEIGGLVGGAARPSAGARGPGRDAPGCAVACRSVSRASPRPLCRGLANLTI